MPEEFTDDDIAIIQSMMGSRFQDLRNPYHAVPPAIIAGGRGEKAMMDLPDSRMPKKKQMKEYKDNAGLARDYLRGMDFDSMDEEGRGPRPLDPRLVEAISGMLDPSRRPRRGPEV